ncbi:hypothetical protein CDD83_3440 [Cordyceps sp. RAO-2017]|nr:hypothetical protein CDD83_3440 [Cordyceps sp. RAO-2017]
MPGKRPLSIDEPETVGTSLERTRDSGMSGLRAGQPIAILSPDQTMAPAPPPTRTYVHAYIICACDVTLVTMQRSPPATLRPTGGRRPLPAASDLELHAAQGEAMATGGQGSSPTRPAPTRLHPPPRHTDGLEVPRRPSSPEAIAVGLDPAIHRASMGSLRHLDPTMFLCRRLRLKRRMVSRSKRRGRRKFCLGDGEPAAARGRSAGPACWDRSMDRPP